MNIKKAKPFSLAFLFLKSSEIMFGYFQILQAQLIVEPFFKISSPLS